MLNRMRHFKFHSKFTNWRVFFFQTQKEFPVTQVHSSTQQHRIWRRRRQKKRRSLEYVLRETLSKVHPVQIYTVYLCKSSRACHPHAIFHLLPTYINNSGAESRINTNTNRHNRVHMVAALLRLTFVLPDEASCLYLKHSAFNTRRTTYQKQYQPFLPLALRQCYTILGVCHRQTEVGIKLWSLTSRSNWICLTWNSQFSPWKLQEGNSVFVSRKKKVISSSLSV